MHGSLRTASPRDAATYRWLVDGRYKGQGYEVRFDVPPAEAEATWIAKLEEAFHEAHEREYGQRAELEVEIVNVRVLGIGRIEDLEYPGARARR